MKQIKDMTTAEWRKAWTEIAIAFETEPDSRYASSGLCDGFYLLTTVVCETEMTMIHSGQYWSKWVHLWYPYRGLRGWRKHHDLLRATFAAMFAAMTPEEFLAICEAPHED